MLSIIDLRDFIDLDNETVQIVNESTELSSEGATELARELLRTTHGIYTLHAMFQDQISLAAENFDLRRERALRKAYNYFARKYPMPKVL